MFCTSYRNRVPAGIQYFIWLWLWLILGIGEPLADHGPADTPISKEIRFDILQDLYPGTNQHDARIALELTMQKTIIQMKRFLPATHQDLEATMSLLANKDLSDRQ